MFIENWSNTMNFSAYYNQCAPSQCSYTYEERFSIPYLISTVCAVIGGLSVALRISIPPVVKHLRRVYHYFSRSTPRAARQAFEETSGKRVDLLSSFSCLFMRSS